MTRREALREAIGTFTANAIADAPFDAEELLRFVLKCDGTALRLTTEQELTQAEATMYAALLERRLAGEPLQYILGEWSFCGRTFRVQKGVLIPRPETEELADAAVAYMRENRTKTAMDLCGGTGCIGLTMALENPEAIVYLLEKYPDPLACISENKELHKAKNAEAVCRDILLPPDARRLPRPSLLVSNPPYVETAALSLLQREVQREPAEALDGGEDGLLFYRAIAELWFPFVCPGGCVLLECGEGQAAEICSLFPKAKMTEIMKDYYGCERFVRIDK